VKALYIDTGHRLAERALAAGGVLRSLTRLRWEISGSCQSPVERELHFRPSQDRNFHGGLGHGHQLPLTANLCVRCRRCEACLCRRSSMWKHRAIRETMGSVRTWFVTLTLSPAQHERMRLMAIAEFDRRGKDPRTDSFECLPEAERWAAVHAQISKEITLYLKRVRKGSGAPLRYLLVTEVHKSGLPHFHLLIHEQSCLAPVRKQLLKTQWKLGFSDVKRCWDVTDGQFVNDAKTAAYLCKYLSKSVLARVRASIRYGQDEIHFGLIKRAHTIAALRASVRPQAPTKASNDEGFVETEHGTDLSGFLPRRTVQRRTVRYRWRSKVDTGDFPGHVPRWEQGTSGR